MTKKTFASSVRLTLKFDTQCEGSFWETITCGPVTFKSLGEEKRMVGPDWCELEGDEEGFIKFKIVTSVPANQVTTCYSRHPKDKVAYKSKKLWDLASQMKYADITIECKGTAFPCHRLVLCSQSPVFEAKFGSRTKESETSKIEAPRLEPSGIQALLEYIYQDLFPSEVSIIKTLLLAADHYGMQDLKRLCIETLKEKIHANNALDMLTFSDINGYAAFKAQILYYLKRDNNLKEIQGTKDWKHFKKENHALWEEITL